MAKVKYISNLDDVLGDLIGDSYELSVKKSGKEATWTNFETNTEVVLQGTGLKEANDDSDAFSAGKVTGVTIFDAEGDAILQISNLNIKATKLAAAFDEGGFWATFSLYLEGDDVVTGTKKTDFLYSGAGDDVLTGKGGRDFFVFASFYSGEVVDDRKAGDVEHDVITDLTTTGDLQDVLSISGELEYTYKGTHKGQDTLLTFDGGSTLLLEGVTKAEYETYAGFDT
jgi:hypothetical protein